jgi:peptide/nickel transport system substrate-binding protein
MVTVAALAAIAGLVGFAATGAWGGTSSASASNSALVVNLGLPPSTLDPAATCSLTESGLAGSFYARLTQYGSKPGPSGTSQIDFATFKPWVAKSWRTNGDRSQYTFTLRPGLRFPSGEPVDAKAVKYSLERTITMNQCGAANIQEIQFKPPLIKKITVPNAATVVVQYSRPNPNAPQDLAQPAAGIVDPSVVEKNGGVKANSINKWMASHAAGYGPFLLDSYEPGKQIVLSANPDFFDPPASKKIIMNLGTSDPTLLLQARSGSADVTLFLSKQAVASLKGNSCCRLIANDAPISQYLNLPQTDKVPALKNTKFREALSYAVPYQQILEKIAFGYGKLYYGEWMPGFPWFTKATGAPRTFDLEKAKRLIKESGVQLPVAFSIVLPEGDETAKQVATAIAGIWSQLNVKATVRQVSPAEHINVVYTTKDQPTMYYDGPAVIAPDYLWAYDGLCNNPYNNLLYCIPKADKLMKQIPYTKSPAARQKILDQVQRLWVAESPRVPVYQDKFVAVLNSKVKSYHFAHTLDMRRWSK